MTQAASLWYIELLVSVTEVVSKMLRIAHTTNRKMWLKHENIARISTIFFHSKLWAQYFGEVHQTAVN